MSSSPQEPGASPSSGQGAEAEPEALAASKRRRAWLVGGGAAALVAVVGLVAVLATGGGGGDDPAESPAAALPAQRTTDLAAAADAAGGTLKSFDESVGEGAHTTDPVDYPMNPPTNGPHHPVWAADGNYAGRATPPTERLVHALEHGRIEIQYRPGLPAEHLAELVALFDESPAHVLLLENATDVDADVAVTAWGHSLVIDEYSAAAVDAIRAFRDEYRDQGPEFVP